ncbi:hypothetical protein EHM76_04025 [bacterium]|nr:MAG: hypothetical protein EHM76_04025 [bacterium]
MGMIYDLPQKYRESIQSYHKATQINPSHEKAQINKNKDIDILDYYDPDFSREDQALSINA